MKGMVINNVYALIPLKHKRISVTNADESNIIGENCENIVFLTGSEMPFNNTIGNNNKNLLITHKTDIEINNFFKRFVFCFNLLFNYKREKI